MGMTMAMARRGSASRGAPAFCFLPVMIIAVTIAIINRIIVALMAVTVTVVSRIIVSVVLGSHCHSHHQLRRKMNMNKK